MIPIFYCEECGPIHDQDELHRRRACPSCGKYWTILMEEEE